MLMHDGRILFSASDLVNFMGCAHATVLDVRNLQHPAIFSPADDHVLLLQEKGIEHEQRYLERLRAERGDVAEIAADLTLAERVAATRAAMAAGAAVIYQGAFSDGSWHGYSDFLLRVDGAPSGLGDYAYEIADTKLARAAKPKHVLQMCVYAHLLEREQGRTPERLHVVLGDGSITSIRTRSIIHYFTVAQRRFEGFAAAPPEESQAQPCGHCAFCRWSAHCEAGWEAGDHLSLLAGLGRSQAEALRAAGVETVAGLAALADGTPVLGLQAATLAKLTAQARLQDHYRRTGERCVERLPLAEGRGLARLPAPSAGDIFFDMEGDPLFEGGLEYLFGVIIVDDGEEVFHPFWAHSRDIEKAAFQAAVDFMTAQLVRDPNAHIYHYAGYEETALKRLAMLHGTREREVDDLLRNHKLVDLYRVVREAIRTSEPGYSIKDMEKFYLGGGRGGEVKTAGDSIVIYERWRRLGDAKLLDHIADYNRLDCRSTLQCRDWLVGMRPDGLPWCTWEASEKDASKADDRQEAEERMASMAATLLTGEGRAAEPWRVLLVDLLEFHRRESKPSWWAMFARQEMEPDALLNDAECLANLEETDIPPRPEKKSFVHTFRFPPQDFKLKPGDTPTRAGTLEAAGEVLAIDEDSRLIELKLGPSRSPIEPGTCLIPPGPIGDKELRAAIYRFAEAVRDGAADRYAAVRSILRRDLPVLTGRTPGTAIAPVGADLTSATIDALLALDHSHLLVQGPPGAGKTYTASQAIVALLERGFRVGIASNGHKAINQLLGEVERLAAARAVGVSGIKKSSRVDQMLGTGGWIEETLDNKSVTADHQLVAGTAWLFAREEHDQAFDYLFIDEAGQVGLANVVAMGVAARNIVLVGDQMQLAQPIQGSHPRDSGVSALQHLLQDNSTVPMERGIFLPETRRMHPDLCQFISDAVYDGRLRSAPGTEHQRLLADRELDPEALASAGLRFVAIDSFACSQRSPVEAERLSRTYNLLLGQRWIGADGTTRTVGLDDILVVSPYNMQVELLKRTLPPGARVGTVDKFQGQEAAVVLVSMATSSSDDLPRNIEFLYSRNRLNVAISRARCLAVIFANSRLLEIPCSTIGQMELVDGLCWAKEFSDHQLAAAAITAVPLTEEGAPA